ncbi:hypothetical protein [uncultured Porphyromonas sp.]|uniref:hypothetical protein n=1 Tax=uncultured Porphyromonas sp. TaxID=159274 RepID=UPI00259BCF5C|nr:hypothetical protein [uncultured Porphyromonas sp.]
MTREEFNTTKWYKGIKVRELGKQDAHFVEGVNFLNNTISFWQEVRRRVLSYEYLEIVEEE